MRRLLLLLFIVACRDGGKTSHDSAPARSTGGAPLNAADSAFMVTGPTLLSSFVTTQQEADSSEEVNEALADYQFYLERAIPVLERHGVTVHLTSDAIVRWRDNLGLHSFPATDSGRIVYLFALPNGRVKVLHNGVEVDGAILSAAREHFGRPIPVPMGETPTR